MPKAQSLAIPDTITPTIIPAGHRSKRPETTDDDGPIDYSFRDSVPKERTGQLTREGKAKAGLTDPRLARLNWFIVRTRPREELRATLLLEQAGHAVFYAREQIFRRKNRYSKSKVGVLRPLTRGYLFVGFAQQPNWLDVLSFQSVLGVIAVNGTPRPVLFEQASSFLSGHAFKVAPEHHKHMISNREFEEGDVVEVLGTALDGHLVQVKKINGKFAEALQLFTGGLQSVIQIPLDNLVAQT